MYAQTEQPKENKNQTKAVTKSQNRGSVNAAAQLVDNRPQTVAQRKRQTEIHSESVQSHGTSTSIIQRVAIPATVTGLTHLVEARNGSIFEGREVREVSHGMTIEIENSDKIRSRRGPNQESNRASDLGNTPAYRWVRVIRVNNEPIGNNIYIRDDTFVTQHPQPLGPRPSVISDDHRERSSDTPGQNVYLLGTTHIDEPQYDESNKVSDGEMAGSDLIVEHPTPLGRRATKLDPTIRDPTQRELLKRANENGAHIIGGDGRKLANANGSIHSLSTPHKHKN